MKLTINLLRLHDFRILLLTRVLGTMALQAQAVIVGWQIYSLTHSTFMLGLIGLTEAVPAICGALVAGHVVDICRPYYVFVACSAGLMLNMLALLLVAGGIVPLPHDVMIIALFAGVFISGMTRSFITPASFALQPRVIERVHLPASTAWLTGGFQLGIIAGPALAGIIYGGYGASAAWLIPLSLMTIEFILLCTMSPAPRQFKSPEKHEPARDSIRAGWKFIIDSKVLLPVMALDMFAVLFGGAVAMLPAFADQILHVGSQGLGILYASPAMGAIAGSLALAFKPLRKIRGVYLLWVFCGFGLCMIGFALSKTFIISMAFLALSGAFDSVNMVIRGSIAQLITPDHMRGRVSAVASMFIISSNEIGAFESGVAATIFGLVPSVILGGIGTLLVVAVTGIKAPQLRKLVIDTEKHES